MNARKWLALLLVVGVGGTGVLGGCYEQRNKSIELMNKGVEFGKQKIYDSAVRNLKTATEVDASNHMAWFNLGVVYKDQKKWEDAAKAFEEAAKLQSGNASYRYEVGAAYAEAKMFDKSRESLEEALKIQRSYKTHYRLGNVLEAMDKPKEADAAYRKAIELNPRFPESFIRLGNLYLDHDHDAEALKVFQEGVKVNDDNGLMHSGYGEALQRLKQYDEAVKEFKKALERNGELFMAVYNVGITYKMMDDKKNAREWLNRFIQSAGTKGSADLVKAASDAMYQLDAP